LLRPGSRSRVVPHHPFDPEEELAHLRHAKAQLPSTGTMVQMLRRIIASITDGLIWLSTWGDSSRMAHALKARDT